MRQTYDIAIIGAGPAGLSAALYAARFRRSTLVLHDDTARAAHIPRTHNVPGYAKGVSGPDLLEEMRTHAAAFGTEIISAHVDAVVKADVFEISSARRVWRSRSLILATGLHLNQIPLPDDVHQQAIDYGVLRYCPVCDGYEHIDKRIGVVGCDISGAGEALFLKQFSSDVTLLAQRDVELSVDECHDLEAAGVKVVRNPVARYLPDSLSMTVALEAEHPPLIFDVLYPALGIRPRNRLAKDLGLRTDEIGKVAANAPFETNVPGLYCAGDLVEGLDQISVAMGHGAIAATKAHNWLRELDGVTVETVLDEVR